MIGPTTGIDMVLPKTALAADICRKISKSRNWYIGLKDFLEKFPADYLRFYLISINPYSQDDLNFDWEQFSTKINSELIGNLGNLVNRALGFTNKTFDGVVPEPEKFDEKDSESEQKIKSLAMGPYGARPWINF